MTPIHEDHTPHWRSRLTALALAVAAPFAIPGGVAQAADLDELIPALEGGWLGNDNDTPFGKMPFAVLFEWTEDGSLQSRSPLNRETYIDLRFERDETGRWLLHEEAAMEGLGTQRYSLIPAPEVHPNGIHRWVWEHDPEFLSIDIGLIDSTMSLDVALRGRPHVSFHLDRQPREVWAEMKREMLARAELSPEEGVSIVEIVAHTQEHLAPPDRIELARRTVTQSPADAAARLDLARLLGQAINEDPANGPRHALEMLSSLQTAVQLDPDLAEAYHYLVGYYLNAPPIAGGSVERAEETARALAEFDPEGSDQLLGQVAAYRAARNPGGPH